MPFEHTLTKQFKEIYKDYILYGFDSFIKVVDSDCMYFSNYSDNNPKILFNFKD
jgi:hypothetical protein